MLIYLDSSKAKSVELSGLPLCRVQPMERISQTAFIHQVRPYSLSIIQVLLQLNPLQVLMDVFIFRFELIMFDMLTAFI